MKSFTLIIAVCICLCITGLAYGLTIERPVDGGAIDLAATTVVGDLITVGPPTTYYNTGFSTPRWEYWWVYFKMTDVNPATTYQFRIDAPKLFGTDDYYGGSYQPSTRLVYSYDGINWQRFDNGAISYTTYYTFSNNSPFSGTTVYVALDIPYTVAMTDAHTASLIGLPHVMPTASSDANFIFNTTLGGTDFYGRSIPSQNLYAYKVTDPNVVAPKAKVLVSTGTHSGEHAGTNTFRGFVDFITGNSVEAQLLRQYVEIFVYPQVDPDGRYGGYSRNNQLYGGDTNRNWGLGTFDNLDKVEAAWLTDAGGDIDIYLDFHAQREQYNSIYGDPVMRSGVFVSNLLARDSSIVGAGSATATTRSRGWAGDSLNAEIALTAETGWMTNITAADFHAHGETYALALYDTLVPPTTIYGLTVVSGSGSGNYSVGDSVIIEAAAAPTGMVFDFWSGDTTGIGDASDANTTITIQAADATITATYAVPPVFYDLVVINGSGSGNYQEGTAALIDANSAPAGMAFYQWTGDVGSVGNIAAESTTITMNGDATVTATYQDYYSLTVVSGNGAGDFTVGDTTSIHADQPTGTMLFLQWAGDTDGVDDVYASDTTFTMPPGDATVTALYVYRGDLDESGAVDIVDLNMVLIDWDKTGVNISDPRSDGDESETVNVIDLNMVLIDWGKSSF